MGRIERAGADVVWETRGEGPHAILFAHNILCDRRVFDVVAEALSHRYRTIAVDLRGHGESAPPKTPYGVRELAGDLVAVLDAEGVQRAHLVGLSIGASTAMELALAHPERVERLVLMGATGSADPFPVRLRNALLVPVVKRIGMRARFADAAVASIFGHSFRHESREATAGFRDRIRALSPIGAAYALRAWSERPRMLERVRALAMPTMVVIGDEDVSCTPEEGDSLHRAIPQSTIVHVARAGHALPAERPIEVAEAVATFLDGERAA